MNQWTGAAGDRALFRTVSAWGVEDVTDDPAVLGSGFHAVVVNFEGDLQAVRFAHVARHEDAPWAGVPSVGAPDGEVPAPSAASSGSPTCWETSLSEAAYRAAVRSVRESIAAGTAYQVNMCRVMSTDGADVDMDGLYRDVLQHNPAPYAARIDVAGVLDIVSASPELFLRLDGRSISSAPIKGTAVRPQDMLDKDVAENIMITDLVRNDLQRVCDAGTVMVDPLLEMQEHPGLAHLVSTVQGRLSDGIKWPDILAGTFPPGSVSGAPKSSALEIIAALEPQARGPYCGAIGWVDGDLGRAELAVGIRTFWRTAERNEMLADPIMSERLSFGTGAGITWGSDPQGEWGETLLKARRLIALVERNRSRES